jgi:hydroxypyruvate isomerase
MPRFAANLHYLFNEVPFLERFAAAAHAGFQGVEFQVPYQWPAAELSTLLREHRLELAGGCLDIAPISSERFRRLPV